MITSSDLNNLRNGEVMIFFSNALTVLNATDPEATIYNYRPYCSSMSVNLNAGIVSLSL